MVEEGKLVGPTLVLPYCTPCVSNCDTLSTAEQVSLNHTPYTLRAQCPAVLRSPL